MMLFSLFTRKKIRAERTFISYRSNRLNAAGGNCKTCKIYNERDFFIIEGMEPVFNKGFIPDFSISKRNMVWNIPFGFSLL